jgi:tricorn protease
MMPTTLRTVLLPLAVGLAASLPVTAQSRTEPADGGTRLLRTPTVSATQVAFAYANDIWIVGRDGGEARRLTSFQGQETDPQLSPDGKWVAFSAQYGGNTDVYVVPSGGGEPQRLTWHPGADMVQGWSANSERVVFVSGREAAPSGAAAKFWSVNLKGEFPEPLVIPRGYQGEYSPDMKRFAYRMVQPWEDEWRNYRGGQNRPVWIMDMATNAVESPPWNGSNDGDPVWLGDVVYFLSDRDSVTNLYAYDMRSKELRQVTRFRDYDVKSLDAGGGVLVFEQAGYVHVLDPAAGQPRRLAIEVRGDYPWLMPRWQDVGGRIVTASLSPTGKRAAFEARGEIFTVPAEKGDWRNLTGTVGVAERTPAWSADGKWVSCFAERDGEYVLVLASPDGNGKPREIAIPTPTFFYTPAFSPDSKKVLFTDTHLRLWVVDVASGQATHADTDNYMAPERSMNPVWSPDSRWIAYAKRLENQFHALFVYDVAGKRMHQLTDGLSDATWPAWDAGGKYLYFLGSTDYGLNTGWLDMSSYERPITRAVYLAVLRKGEPSPLLPESDEEGAKPDSAAAAGAKPAEGAKAESGKGPAKADVVIDFDGMLNRIVTLDLPARNYGSLRAGSAGFVFYLEPVPNQQGATLQRYSLKERKATAFMVGVQDYQVSADGKKLLYRAPGGGATAAQNWFIVDADKAVPKAGDGRLALSGMRMRVDPRAEFAQMFHEGWRFQRDYLYVDNLHGADYVQTGAMYEPLLAHVAHRSDLIHLMDMMGGEVSIGHSFVRGGDVPAVDPVAVGLLGADLEVANGHYRLRKVYTGENWNPELRAPLASPGAEIAAGEYLLSVNGVELRAPANPYAAFEGLANRQVSLSVGPNPDGTGARAVTVVPVASEAALRQRDWVESNRRKVDQLSGGRLAYVWVPNTSTGGYSYFTRYYFAQQQKQGAIIDERFNSGGSAADYLVDLMSRRLHGYFNNRVAEHRPFTSPGAGIWGPKVMIVNEMAGSGGDLLPYMFKFLEIGPVVGTRTWGGLVGTWDTPPLIDGGSMIAPRGGFFDASGEWAVENEGVAPTITVEMTPADVIRGGDPQLEAAVAEALRLLRENPVEMKAEPRPPVRARRPVIIQ